MNPTYSLDSVPNQALLGNLKQLVGSSNELTAHLLAHLAEVEGRGIYRECACASLYTYCVYELRFSEDEAQRRCRAARVARQFPLIFDMLADASIHLTGILLLAPHLTQANHVELLARARYRSKREIEKLVSEVAPCPDAPSLIQPLGPSLAGAAQRAPATWASFVRSWAGPVRDLVPGDRTGQAPLGALARQAAAENVDMAGKPFDGGASGLAACGDEVESSTAAPDAARASTGAGRAMGSARQGCASGDPAISDAGSAGSVGSAGAPSTVAGVPPRHDPAAPARQRLEPCAESSAESSRVSAAPARQTFESRAGEPLVGLRYRLQFTADQGYVDLLEQARDLLQHQVPDRDLARVHRLAIEALLEKLSKRKYSGLAPKGSSRGAGAGVSAGLPCTSTSLAAAPAGAGNAGGDITLPVASASSGFEPARAAESMMSSRTVSTAERSSSRACAEPAPAELVGAGRASVKPGCAESGCAEPGCAEPGCAESGCAAGAAPARAERTWAKPAEPVGTGQASAEPGCAEPGCAESGCAEPGCAESGCAAGAAGAAPARAEPTWAKPAEPVGARQAAAEVGCAEPASAAGAAPARAERTDPNDPGRYIPAALRRRVWERDGGRCTFTDARGERCRETRWLEFHHQDPYARGGSTRLDNLCLHCRSHNRLAAERDFGRDFIVRKASAASAARARDPV